MPVLAGPRMYYSLFGMPGVFLGAKARFSGKPREVSVAVSGIPHPLQLRLRTTDIALCREVLLDSQYDCDLDISPRTIVDAGANIGLASVFYANKFPQAKIIALEPEASNYEMLAKNTAPYPNITARHAALWSSARDLQIFNTEPKHTAFQVRSPERQNETKAPGETVRAVTMEGILAEFQADRIDLLKIDIEGAEKEVFEDAAKWIDRVGVIAIELHDWMRPGCSSTVEAATKDFTHRWQAGETTYFARNQAVAKSSQKLQLSPNSEFRRKNTGPRFPLRILHAS